MQHTIIVDSHNHQLTVTTSGDGDVVGVVSFLEEIIVHPHWKTGNNILLDHRNLRFDKVKMDGVHRIARFFKSISPKLGDGKIAFVMNRDIDFGIARAWEILTADEVDIQIEVFRSIEKARTWLDT